jgi:hypothetical protein
MKIFPIVLVFLFLSCSSEIDPLVDNLERCEAEFVAAYDAVYTARDHEEATQRALVAASAVLDRATDSKTLEKASTTWSNAVSNAFAADNELDEAIVQAEEAELAFVKAYKAIRDVKEE